MTRGDKRSLAVVVVVLAVVCSVRLCWDLQHPEEWNDKPLSDPRSYLWGWAAGAIFICWIARRIVSLDRNGQRRRRVRALLVRAEALVKQHRRDEAEAVLKECKALLSTAKPR
jgi:hypothetical protein